MKINRIFGIFGYAIIGILSMASISLAGTMNICTGTQGGNYEYVGLKIQQQLKGQTDVNVIHTAGSWDNLKRLNSGECDGAIVQSDALYLWEKEKGSFEYTDLSPLYTEYAHLLCNRNSPVKSFGDLTEKSKVYSGGNGSGANVTIRGLIYADAEYGGNAYSKVPLLNENDPDLALLHVKTRKNGADCLFYVGSKGNKYMSVNAEKFNEFLHLVPIVDKDFNDVTMTDSDGNKMSVWTPTSMPSHTYGKIMPRGTLWGNSDLKTIGVTAHFIVSDKWAENSENREDFKNISYSIDDVANIVRVDRGVELVD